MVCRFSGAAGNDGSDCPLAERDWLHRDDRWRISIHAVGANAKGTLGVARSRTDISSCFTLQGLGDTVFSLCLLTSPGVDPPESRVLIREHGWRFDSSGFRVR